MVPNMNVKNVVHLKDIVVPAVVQREMNSAVVNLELTIQNLDRLFKTKMSGGRMEKIIGLMKETDTAESHFLLLLNLNL